MKNFGKIILLAAAFVLGLVGCGGDGTSSAEQTSASVLEFDRQLKINCDDFPCTKGPISKLKLSDYDAGLLDWAGITPDDTKKTFKSKISMDPTGIMGFTHGSESHWSVDGRTFLLIHKATLDNPYRNQYDYYAEFETTPNDDGKILSWGARIQCSTIEDKNKWQTTPCPEPDFLFERQWYECVDGDCERSSNKRKFTADEFSRDLIDWVDLSGPIGSNDFVKKLMDSYDGDQRGEYGSASVFPVSYGILHLHPDGTSLNEYEIYHIQRNENEVLDWGARVRCAPVTATTPWQTTPC